MSEWKEDRIAHHEARDDLSIERPVRMGKKQPPKDRPWAICQQYTDTPFFMRAFGITRRYYSKERDARQELSHAQRNSVGLPKDVWIEYEGVRQDDQP